MSYAFTLADVDFLSSSAGEAALATVDGWELSKRSLVRDVDRARLEFGAVATAVVETTLLRRRARGKLDDRPWLLTDDALQQATPIAVARHRAQRLAGRVVHDVTCSIGAELVALVDACPAVLGSDLDAVRLAMAARNVPGATLIRADALQPCTRDAVVLADPGRRSGGRRTHDPAQLQPPLPELLDAYRGRDLVVKCAPGLDFDRLEWDGEVEVTSLDGGVREACLWSESLSEKGIRRRATVLRADGSETLTDADPDDIPEREPGEWIVNPDGAIVRAGLVRHYAAKHGLWQLDPRIAYLTGDAVPAGARGFRILHRLRFDRREIRKTLHALDCGALEILVRGLDVDPDQLRAQLKLRGDRPLALIATRIGRAGVAFVAESH